MKRGQQKLNLCARNNIITMAVLLLYFSTEVQLQTRDGAYSKCAQQVCAQIKQPS